MRLRLIWVFFLGLWLMPTMALEPAAAAVLHPFWGVFLLALGVILVILEVLVAGFGVLGLAGVASFLTGSIFLLRANYVESQIPLLMVTLVVVLTVALLALVVVMAWRSWRKPVVSGQEALIGQQGNIDIDSRQQLWLSLVGERWQCVCKEPLSSGQRVTVIAVGGVTLVVTPTTDQE